MINHPRLLSASFVIAAALSGCATPEGKCSHTDADGTVHIDLDCNEKVSSVDDTGPGTTDSDTDTDDSATHTGETGDSDTDDSGETGITPPVDADSDGYTDDVDCDDGNAAVNPGAAEVCNGVDDNCDGGVDEDVLVTYYADADGDGYGDSASTVEDCDAPAGYVENAADCDDSDAAYHPYAIEDCSATDDLNCDGSFGTADADGDGVVACEDCDDSDAANSPLGTETCDGADNDCDIDVDEDAVDALIWYTDADGDTFGDASSTTSACSAPTGYVSDDSDCDDGDGSVNPGATEVCDEIDNDCSGEADDGLAFDVWFEDLDSDGYGNSSISVTTCDGAPVSYVGKSDDCDDGDGSVNPGATEVCNGVDDDCEGSVDEMAADASSWYADVDRDGFGDPSSLQMSCDAPSGYVADATDCDDGDANINPGATESCNGTDDDCDGSADESGAAGESTWYLDSDGDGYGGAASMDACDQPSGYEADGSDCDDSDSSVYPGATETIGNGVDEDCDGSDAITTDADGDGYDDVAFGGTDCDDGNSGINPGATEVCNGADDDCDGSLDEAGATGESTWYEDADRDGYGDVSSTEDACDQPSGYVSDDTDCDDGDSGVNPGEADIAGDGIDQNCDGVQVFYAEDFGAGSGSCTVGDFVRSDGNSLHQGGSCVIYIQEAGSLTAPSISVDVTVSGLTVGESYAFEYDVSNVFVSSVTIVADVDRGTPETVTLATGDADTLTVDWTADSTSVTARIWTTGTSYYDGILSEFRVVVY